MKKHALVAGLVLASSFATTPMAVAQTPAPAVLDVAAAAACGRVTLTATVKEDFNQNGFDTYEIAVFSGPNAGGSLSNPEGQFFVTAEKPVVKTFTLDEDVYDGSGFVTWSTVSGPNPEFFVRGAIAVDTDCAPPVTTTTPAPTTTAPPPAATTTVTAPPTTTVAPPAGPVYPTCADAVAAGAAPIAAGEPGYRPELDSDNDGVACDLATDTDPGDSGFSQVGVVPQGGVDTGTR